MKIKNFRIPQIPVQLLPHSCVLVQKEKSSSVWGGTDEETRTDLSHVRIEGASKLLYSVQGNEATCSKTMFYDCVNSNPNGVQFRLDDEIEFDGDTFTIKVIDPKVTDINNHEPHHLEFGLV